MTRRRKTEIGVFRHNPTEIPRNNRFTNARKTGILYHVPAPVAQLDRALDSDNCDTAGFWLVFVRYSAICACKNAVVNGSQTTN